MAVLANGDPSTLHHEQMISSEEMHPLIRLMVSGVAILGHWPYTVSLCGPTIKSLGYHVTQLI